MLAQLMPIDQRKNAFSLIEVIIYVAILSTALLVVGNLLLFLLSFWQSNKIKKSIMRNSSYINLKLSKDVSEAYAISGGLTDSFSSELSLVSSSSGQINYAVIDNVLSRNNEPISDDEVLVVIDQDGPGYRQINSSIDWHIKILSKHQPFVGTQSAEIIKGTGFMPNLK